MRRIALFMTILERLCAAAERTLLASPAYDQTHVTPTRLSHALSYIGKNLASDLRESDLAQLTGQSVSAFSRAFHRHTGMPFVQYVNRLRIEAACQMLLDERANITDICFQAGFNNVSNFNRQFRAVKGMAPSEFRALQRLNARSRELALHAAPTGNPMPPRVVTPGAPGFAAHPG
ncbi:HTH-type transcriptional regulator YesS [Burkholderia multivorans]|nr:HTH-type transcriptional regulator YesS [Burkholderia multivorans]